MRRADAWAINDRGIPSLTLMETAGRSVADAVAEISPKGPVRVVCGKGNNAGDGLVAARHLRMSGHQVQVIGLWPDDEFSPDSAANLELLGAPVLHPDDISDALAGSGAIIDAIFGTGFSGVAREPAAAAIAAINAANAPVVACDIASGVDAGTGEVEGPAVSADLTVTFHSPKIGHRIAPGKAYTGDLCVEPIGIPDGAPVSPSAGVIESGVLDLAPRRGAGSNKFTSGQVVIIGGSRGLTGAVCLSSAAAIRAGAGYATAVVPADLEPIIEAKLTEVMSIGCDGASGRLGTAGTSTAVVACEMAAAVVLGPGLGRDRNSLDFAQAVAGAVSAPLLIDADALGAFAGRIGQLKERLGSTVLTPHAGELGRLLGVSSEEIQKHRLTSARQAALESGCVVVLKGDDTIVTDGREVAVNALPAPGLATAGTGDVLSGMIGGLLARGLLPFDAACAGVFSHARAGRVAASHIGSTESVIATDVIDSIPVGLRSDSPVD